MKPIAIILAISFVLGATNFAVAKASEKVFKSIPISEHAHKHSIMNMFKSPMDAPINTQTFNIMGIDMTEQQAREHCTMNGMEQMEVCQQFLETTETKTTTTIVPAGHDNSDGHHN